jgi:hypothetical protein
MGKPSKAVVKARIEEILRIRLDGAEFWDIREYVREKCAEPGSVWEAPACLSDAQIYRYIARTDKQIADSCRSSRKRLMRRHLAQRRNIYAKAVSAGDLRTALSTLADEAKMLGLYAPTKLEHSGRMQYQNVTDADLDAEIAALQAVVSGGAPGEAAAAGDDGGDPPETVPLEARAEPDR